MRLPLTIKDNQNNLLEKKYSTVELVDNYLKRILTLDKRINSFITITDEIALSKAKWTDEILKKEKYPLDKYPLLGTIISFKDMFLTKGVETTAGSKLLKNFIPSYSASVVERIESLGGIIIGKNNQDAWAHGSSGENSDFESTKNPWNQEYVPGGSSSGSAAAVSSDFTMISFGTDTCGSIRMPASFCGVTGIKPTYGTVSRYGVIAMASSFDTVGHIAKTAEDIEKIFFLIKGKDGYDSNVSEENYDINKKVKTIGVPKEFFVKNLNQEIAKSVSDVLKVFKKEGFNIKEVSLPTTKYAISVYYIIQPAEVSSNLARYDGIRFGNGREAFEKEGKRRIMLGSYVLSSGYVDKYYKRATKVRSKVIEEIEKVFSQVDVLIAPSSPELPFKFGEKLKDPLKMYLNDVYTATASISGIPSLSIPVGFSKSNLPIGAQIMGPRYSESNIYKLAKIYQRVTDYHIKRPKI